MPWFGRSCRCKIVRLGDSVETVRHAFSTTFLTSLNFFGVNFWPGVKKYVYTLCIQFIIKWLPAIVKWSSVVLPDLVKRLQLCDYMIKGSFECSDFLWTKPLKGLFPTCCISSQLYKFADVTYNRYNSNTIISLHFFLQYICLYIYIYASLNCV